MPPRDPQLSFLPLDSPSTVLNHLTQLLRRITRLEPDLTGEHCVRLLGELALVNVALDRMEVQARASAAAAAKRFSLIA